MNNIFSQDLINRTIEYFKERHDHHITEEEAIQYLHSFADLFAAFGKLLEEQQNLSAEKDQGTVDGEAHQRVVRA